MSAPLSAVVYRLGATAAATVALAGPCLAQHPDAIGPIAAENAVLTAQIADGTSALDRASVELAALRKAKGELDESLRRIERRAEVHALGREFMESAIRP